MKWLKKNWKALGVIVMVVVVAVLTVVVTLKITTPSGVSLKEVENLIATAVTQPTAKPKIVQPTREPTQVTLVEEPTPPPLAEAPKETSGESWHRITVSKFFDVIGDEKWELPLGTWFATDISEGRYTPMESLAAGPQTDSTDAGWCQDGQYGCPPHLMLYKAEVLSGVNVIMDIPTRILMGTTSNNGGFRLQLRFNNETRTPSELTSDYDIAGSQGQLGLFVAIVDSTQPAATLEYRGQELEVGYACWDCLAHTSGENDNIISLDDVNHFGQQTPSQGSSMWPGYVIPIPAPNANPDFEINLEVRFPKETGVVVWLGRYDIE